VSELKIVLGIDTCGPTGSVALARLRAVSIQMSPSEEHTGWHFLEKNATSPRGFSEEQNRNRCTGESVEILGQTELEGRSYSATLLAAIAELLERNAVKPRELAGIVVVNGPGSFTGVRVGLGTVKGLAEGAQLPVKAVSRLEVLAAKAGTRSAALDAHRHEVFLRVSGTGLEPREMLAGAAELAEFDPVAARIALCDEAAQTLLKAAWPAAELVWTEPPTAADALRLCAPRLAAGEHADVAALDGHYLRRSDAEIFGEAAAAPTQHP
jgi:tRNA threonylcarbamoyladenosine biosynthesis protein TsaB